MNKYRALEWAAIILFFIGVGFLPFLMDIFENTVIKFLVFFGYLIIGGNAVGKLANKLSEKGNQ